MSDTRIGAWVQFAIVSAFFFVITGTTFTSMGVVLPHMIADLSWTWSQAGIGFSLLALLTGLAGTLPAWTLRHYGIKTTFGLGGLCIAVGFAMFAITTSLLLYFIGAAVIGVGFALCATVPGVHIISNWMPERRSFAIGVYMTIGGLGGVVGPRIVTTIVDMTGSWRVHWWTMALSMLVLCAVALPFVKSKPRGHEADATTVPTQEKGSDRVFRTAGDWRFRDAVLTPQYLIIVTAMTLTLLAGLTVNSNAVGHMVNLGITANVASWALSGHAGINAMSRALGGALATRIDPKWLLVAALVSEIVGSLALSVADSPTLIAVFAFGEGFGYGMCFFATTMLLVNYFGTTDNPQILGTMHTVTTAAMVGPALAGAVYDTFGSFAYAFQGYAVVLLIIAVAAALMRPPSRTLPQLAKAEAAE